MIDIAPAPACQHAETKKHGRDPSGNQRMRCKACGATWIIKPAHPLGDMRIDQDKAIFALRLLLEGTSIRATERLTRLPGYAVRFGRNHRGELRSLRGTLEQV